MRNGTLSHELCDGNKNEKTQGGTNMKRKMVSVALCAAMTAGVLAGGAVTVSAEDKLVVYGIYKAGDQTWFIDEGAAAQKAVEEAGGEFVYVDAKMNPEEYLKAIDNAIANFNQSFILRPLIIFSAS